MKNPLTKENVGFVIIVIVLISAYQIYVNPDILNLKDPDEISNEELLESDQKQRNLTTDYENYRRLKLLNRYLLGYPSGCYHVTQLSSIVGFVLFSLHLQHAKFSNKLDLTEN